MILRPDQAEDVATLRAICAEHGAAVAAHEPGCGKTPIFLTAPPPGAPAIVAVPAALKAQTAERIIQWRGSDQRVRVVEGVGTFAPPAPGEWVVTNPDILPATAGEARAADEDLAEALEQVEGQLPLDAGQAIDAADAARKRAKLARRGTFDPDDLAPGTWFIGDEAHEFSAFKAAQTKRVRAMVRGCRRSGGSSLLVTATPLLNDPGDLRAFLATAGLGGAAWPSSQGRSLDYWSYLRDWGGSKGQWGEAWIGEPNDARIAAALRRVMVRRLLRDVVSLPPLLPTQRIPVDLDATTRALADEADAVIRARLGDLDRKAERIVFEAASKLRAALAVAKLPAAHAWCNQMERIGEPAVVACVSVDVAKSVARRPGWARITGDVPDARRAEIVREFQSGRLRGVALTHRAGGVGIDLFRAARLLMVTREWNPALNRQTLARVLRHGQERSVELSLLMARHVVEDRLDELMAMRKRWLKPIDACAVRPGVAA